MHLMLEGTHDEKRRQRLYDQLTGRLRTIGKPMDPDEVNAPSWWHGDEEAYESAMLAASLTPRRR